MSQKVDEASSPGNYLDCCLRFIRSEPSDLLHDLSVRCAQRISLKGLVDEDSPTSTRWPRAPLLTHEGEKYFVGSSFASRCQQTEIVNPMPAAIGHLIGQSKEKFVHRAVYNLRTILPRILATYADPSFGAGQDIMSRDRRPPQVAGDVADQGAFRTAFSDI